MADLPDPRELIGRETPRRDLVLEPSRVHDFLEAIEEAGAPFRTGSQRFAAPILPPTIWSLVRPGGDPEVAVPRYGSGLNGGNRYRWLQPVRAGDPLTRETRIEDAYQRDGRTGRLTFFVFESTFRRPDGEVVATAQSTSVQRG